jgi:hypothetical protein
MKKVALSAALAASFAVSACATNPYGYNDPYGGGNNDQARRAATGAAGGAVAGAVLGAVVNGRQYYRDTRGYCYYVDQQGRPIYDYNTRC